VMCCCLDWDDMSEYVSRQETTFHRSSVLSRTKKEPIRAVILSGVPNDQVVMRTRELQ
jgi:hypothetical protein